MTSTPTFTNPPDDVIRAVLATPRRIAVVGCSPHPDRDSYRVAAELLRRGHTVVPVRPGSDMIFGQRCFPSLKAIPGRVDMVEVFRRPDAVAEVVDETLAIGAPVLWLQLGVIDPVAAARAVAAGVTVVMDRCPLIEYARLF